MGAGDYVIYTDEKTSIQARCRCDPSLLAGQVPHDAGQPRLPPTRRDRLPGRLRRALRPFKWKFTTGDLDDLLTRLDHPAQPRAA